MYVSLIQLWTTKTPPQKHPRDVPGEVIFEPAMFDSLISALNARRTSKECAVYQQKEEKWESLSNSAESLITTTVLVRQVNNRWECFSYFNQDRSLEVTSDRRVASSTSSTEECNTFSASSGPVSDQISKPILSDGKASNTFSAIVQIDTKPINGSGRLPDPLAPNSSPITNSFENSSIESMTMFLGRALVRLNNPILRLGYWIEVSDVSKKEAMRPTVGRLCSEIRKAGFTAIEMLKLVS